MLRQLKNKHKGETCVVVGNGPSLDDTPLVQLGKKYPTFGANKIYEYPFTPTYWTCVDLEMLNDCIPWLRSHTEFKPDVKFVNRDDIIDVNTIRLNVQYGQYFSGDALRAVFIGGTVTYVNLQLALYLGFDKVILVGCDHSYTKASAGKAGTPFVADGNDPDHFGEGYFTKGKTYNRPSLENITNYFYPLALQEYHNAGKDIINCSLETTLECFEREPLENYL